MHATRLLDSRSYFTVTPLGEHVTITVHRRGSIIFADTPKATFRYDYRTDTFSQVLPTVDRFQTLQSHDWSLLYAFAPKSQLVL